MKSGWTLLEVLVVIAITIVVAAISFPIITSAKDRASEASCSSNLRQLWVAIELYRPDNSPDVGTPHEMGLPSDAAFASGAVKTNLKCPRDRALEGPRGYQYMPGGDSRQMSEAWSEDVNRYGQGTILYSDWNHNKESDFNRELFPKLGLGVSLQGNLIRRRAPGQIGWQAWWHKKETNP